MHKYFSGCPLNITWVIFSLGYLEISALTRPEHRDRWSDGDANSPILFCQTGSLFNHACNHGHEHIFLWVPQCQQLSTLVSLVAAASLVWCLSNGQWWEPADIKPPSWSPSGSECRMCQLLLLCRKCFLLSPVSLLPVSVHASFSACSTYFRYFCVNIPVTV